MNKLLFLTLFSTTLFFTKSQKEIRHKYPTQAEIGRALFWCLSFCTFHR